MAGRKGKYEYWLSEEGKTLIIGWLKRGLKDKEIAERIGISKTTMCQWKIDYPEFADLFNHKKDFVIMAAEEGLRKCSTGYFVEETKIIAGSDGSPLKIEKTKKYIKPDVVAIMYLLQNMAPETWKNVQRMEHTGKNGGPIETKVEENPYSKLSVEQLKKLADEL